MLFVAGIMWSERSKEGLIRTYLRECYRSLKGDTKH